MGNFLFQNLVALMQPNKLGFKRYILAAPDLDCDVFEEGQTFENLHQQIPHITLLRHRFDRTLGVSKMLLKKKRLGRHGLTRDTPSVKTVDVTWKWTKGLKDRITHHLYLYKSPKVVNMIGAFFD